MTWIIEGKDCRSTCSIPFLMYDFKNRNTKKAGGRQIHTKSEQPLTFFEEYLSRFGRKYTLKQIISK